jgi:hypothetical protein
MYKNMYICKVHIFAKYEYKVSCSVCDFIVSTFMQS